MATQKTHLDTIVCAAVEIASAEDRASFIISACGGDQELRARVQKLADAHFRAGHFLESPAAGFPSPLEGEGMGVRGSTLDDPITERPGTVIGPYRLMEQIGEGGMGLVYVAEQQQPIRRRVALKLIKPGMDTRQVVARFEAERQALALMDHPNIAKVLDAGTTEPISDFRFQISDLQPKFANRDKSEISNLKSEISAGRPYFVMELVRGVAITEYCDANRLALRERLGLFVPVCQAVQHAHQKGIIHRDLKPSNVMVTLHDGVPVVKVIDFGVAKAIGQQLTDKSIYTRFTQMIGTPLYMSPEQAEMSGLDVDTRSDIYSLGVLLYELLTGTTPFDKERLQTVGYDEMRRIIREEEPPTPSTRISTLGRSGLPSRTGPARQAGPICTAETTNAETIATNRKTDPKKLSQLCRGELDWIVMKALEKDRNRRYETANGLARDIERYLNDEPVQACPPSAWYRFRKLARRNRAVLAVAGVVFGALLVTVASLAISNVRITREKQEKEQALQEARANAEAAEQQRRRARQAVDDFYVMVSESTLLNEPTLKPLRRQLLQSALDYYQSFLAEQRDDPRVQAEVAATWIRVSRLRSAMGSRESWFDAFQKGLEIVEKLVDSNVAAADLGTFQRGVARGSGISYPNVGNPAEVHATFLKAQKIWEKLVKENPTVTGFQSDLAMICMILGFLESKPAEKARDFERACQLWENLVQANAAVPDNRNQLAVGLTSLGSTFLGLNRRPEAEKALRKGLAILEKLTTEFPAVPAYRSDLCNLYSWLSTFLLSAGQTQQALEIKQKELSNWDHLAASHPTVPEYRSGLASGRMNFADLLQKIGRTREAEQVLQRSLADLSRAIELDPTNASTWASSAAVYAQLGQWGKAVADLSKSIELDPKQPAHWDNRGRAYMSLAQPDKGIADFNRAIELGIGPYVWYARALAHLQRDDRTGYRKDCAAMLNHFDGSSSPDAAYWTVWTCVLIPDALEDWTQPLQLAEKALATDPNNLNGLTALGAVLYRAGRFDSAAQRLTQAEAAFKIDKGSSGTIAYTWLFQAMTHEHLGKAEKATELLAKAVREIEHPRTAQDIVFSRTWNRKLTFQLLRREAEALIGRTDLKTDDKEKNSADMKR
jgi:serine/threonine protein kinase/Flp pilus assembly protein TadD